MTARVTGYACPALDTDGLVAQLRASGASVAVFRADRVFGAAHLTRAHALARRAMAEGRARSRDLATETMLYAAGDRQIGRAIALMGLAPGVETLAALTWDVAGATAVEALAETDGWRRDDGVLGGTRETLDALGIDAVQRDHLPADRWIELVWERSALLDVAKA